jgi:hypothetical protein
MLETLFVEISRQNVEEFGEPFGMSWPCRTGYEISIRCGVRDVERNEDTACELDIGSAGWVGVLWG